MRIAEDPQFGADEAAFPLPGVGSRGHDGEPSTPLFPWSPRCKVLPNPRSSVEIRTKAHMVNTDQLDDMIHMIDKL